MNIVCIKECYNLYKQPFKIGGVYRYEWDDCVEGVSGRFFAIYEYDDVSMYPTCMGYCDTDFLESNFLSVGEFNRENEQVCSLFNFFMDYGHNGNSLGLSLYKV